MNTTEGNQSNEEIEDGREVYGFDGEGGQCDADRVMREEPGQQGFNDSPGDSCPLCNGVSEHADLCDWRALHVPAVPSSGTPHQCTRDFASIFPTLSIKERLGVAPALADGLVDLGVEMSCDIDDVMLHVHPGVGFNYLVYRAFLVDFAGELNRLDFIHLASLNQGEIICWLHMVRDSGSAEATADAFRQRYFEDDDEVTVLQRNCLDHTKTVLFRGMSTIERMFFLESRWITINGWLSAVMDGESFIRVREQIGRERLGLS